MKPILLMYRLAYGVFLVVVLGVLVKEIYLRERINMPETIPLFIYACIVAFILVATIAFRRIPASLLWAGTLLLCGLFTWYAWYSLGAPFVLHEVHSLDPKEAAAEIHRSRTKGEIIFALLIAWFISFPIVRQFSVRPGSRSCAPK